MTTNNIIIDEATGLPELPEKYFWRVRYPDYSKNSLYVEIRRTTFFGSKEVNKGMVLVSVATPERILEKSLEVYETFKATQIDTVVAGLLGDYPPKKMGA